MVLPIALLHPRIGHIIQPTTYVNIGLMDVKTQSTGLQARGKRNHKAALEIGIESLDLALGLRAIRFSELWNEAAALPLLPQIAVPTVIPLAISITFDDHSLGVIEQDMLRDAAEVVESLAQSVAQ